ncbi:MAG: ribonuclease P protein component 4 [Candidatus Nanohaloarchaea archaeon]|nr:ribonuclease P protein component 4 [Candidatus Nanohaloarchaea archaeon]
MDEEQIARERIDILFERAREEFQNHPERSDRYVEIARNIAMKYTLSLPRKYRKKFCSNCKSFLVAGENCRARLNHGEKVITCEECGEASRFGYSE